MGQPGQFRNQLDLFAFSGRVRELHKPKAKAGKTLFAVNYYLPYPLRHRQIMSDLEKRKWQIVISSISVVCLGRDTDGQGESLVKLKGIDE